MYISPALRTIARADPAMRWHLPDRVFFACGACHILAHAFIERFDATGDLTPMWLHPKNDLPGNHIIVSGGDWVFDYHGYSNHKRFMDHCFRRARQRWPGWDADIIPLPRDVLISEPKSREFDGLWLREPQQFLHDALPRARRFLDRFSSPQRRPSQSASE